jgi:hypothetical protein
LDVFTTSLKGLVPSSGGGTTNFLRADGAWSPAGTSLSDGDKGDITVSGSGAVWTIDNNVVTYAKIQNISTTDRLLGRDTAGAGIIEEISVSGGLEFTGGPGIRTSAFTGDVTKSAGGTVLTIANDIVTYAKMQNISATSRFLGRITAGAGDTEELTGTQATTLLNTFTSALKGLVPPSGGGTVNFLRADGTFTTPAGTGVTTGAFTPVLSFGGASVGITYATQHGSYQRVNKWIHFNLTVELSDVGTSTGAALITGLPFSISVDSPVSFWIDDLFTNAGATVEPLLEVGTSEISFYELIDGDVSATIDESWFTSSAFVIISGTYQTNDP